MLWIGSPMRKQPPLKSDIPSSLSVQLKLGGFPFGYALCSLIWQARNRAVRERYVYHE